MATDSIPAGKRDNAPLREREKTINRDIDDSIVPDGGGMTVLQLVKKYTATTVSYTHLDVYKRQADYRVALKKIKEHPKDRKAIDEALEIERFFRSGWYSQLTSVDGEYLIKRLQDEVRQSESIRGRKNKSNRR